MNTTGVLPLPFGLGYELLPVIRPLGRTSCVQICSRQICPRAIAQPALPACPKIPNPGEKCGLMSEANTGQYDVIIAGGGIVSRAMVSSNMIPSEALRLPTSGHWKITIITCSVPPGTPQPGCISNTIVSRICACGICSARRWDTGSLRVNRSI